MPALLLMPFFFRKKRDHRNIKKVMISLCFCFFLRLVFEKHLSEKKERNTNKTLFLLLRFMRMVL